MSTNEQLTQLQNDGIIINYTDECTLDIIVLLPSENN